MLGRGVRLSRHADLAHPQAQPNGHHDQGYLFSAVIIFLGNVAVLLVGIPLLVSKVGVLTALGWWLECTGETLHRLGRMM